MASVNLQYLILKDNWPGKPSRLLGVPEDGFDATRWSDATTAGYEPGTKIEAWSDNTIQPGPYQMIYLGVHCLSGLTDLSSDFSTPGYGIVQHACNSVMDNTVAWYQSVLGAAGVDTGFKEGTALGMVAVLCSSFTSNDLTTDGGSYTKYAWAWCGGVCPPISDITMFNAEMTTDGNIAAGKSFYVTNDSSVLVFSTTDISANIVGYSTRIDG